MTEMVTETATEIPSPTAAQAAEETVATGETPAAVETEQTGQTATEEVKAPEFDPYMALDHDLMKPVLEQRDKRRERDLRTELDSQYAEKTRSWEATQTANTLAGYFGNLAQKIADSDPEAFDKSVQSMMSFAAPLMKDYETAIKAQASKEAAGGLYHYMAQSLKTRDRDDFERYIESDRVSWPDAFKEYVRLANGEELAKKDAKIAELDDTIGKMKAEGRSGQGPNLTPSAPGGGGINSYEEASRRYNLPIGHSQKLSHEQFKEQRLRFGVK